MRMGILGLLLVMAVPVYGSSITPYVDVQFGMGRFSRDISETLTQSSWGEYFKASVGFQARHSLSVGVAARLWGTADDEDEDEENIDWSHTFLHDFHYFGASIGAEVLMLIPGNTQGPFIRFTRQCWTATISDLEDNVEREDDSCGNSYGFGLIGGSQSQPGGLILEVEFSKYETISSTTFSIGGRF